MHRIQNCARHGHPAPPLPMRHYQPDPPLPTYLLPEPSKCCTVVCGCIFSVFPRDSSHHSWRKSQGKFNQIVNNLNGLSSNDICSICLRFLLLLRLFFSSIPGFFYSPIRNFIREKGVLFSKCQRSMIEYMQGTSRHLRKIEQMSLEEKSFKLTI